jgi:hypothetical protein
MKLAAMFVPLIAVGTAPTVAAAQTAALPLCDDIVTRVRAAPAEDAWSVLTEGDRSYIETAMGRQRSELFGGAGYEEVVERFVARFDPSEELRKAWTDWIG